MWMPKGLHPKPKYFRGSPQGGPQGGPKTQNGKHHAGWLNAQIPGAERLWLQSVQARSVWDKGQSGPQVTLSVVFLHLR